MGMAPLRATLTGDLVGQPTLASPILAAPIVIPANAVMATGVLIGTFTQINLPAYPYTFANVLVNPTTAASGGLVRAALKQKVVATGYTARHAVVDTAKCNNCHDQLGTNPNFHGGARNDATACAFCHTGNRTSNGWSADASTFVHGIHGHDKRTVAFMWNAVSRTDDFDGLLYPGALRKCEQCHVPNTYNFAATNNAAAVPNLLWSTTATGIFNGTSTNATAYQISPYVVADNVKNYGNGFTFTPAGASGEIVPADGATLVNSPIASACFSCHDTGSAKAHMVTNGGAIYETRSTALAKTETCLVCHGAGKVADVKAVHLYQAR
jgi:OmcA/MtrC family decaheme c-type cytochrome